MKTTSRYISSKQSLGVIALALLSFSHEQAFGQAADWVTVGNIGNAADSNGYGAVGYEYRIGKYEVTNNQYTAFLNAKAQTDPNGLYNFNHGNNPTTLGIIRSGTSGSYSYSVAAGSGNKPVAYVNWFDAVRYINWMENGQGSGDTESGVYNLSLTGIARMTPASGATYRLPTANEWYKAAYYDPTKGGSGGYWEYATKSDSAPIYAPPGLGENLANIAPGPSVNPKVHDVGSYVESESYYGTYDQNGNLYEWVNQTTDGGDAFAKGSGWAFGADQAAKTTYGTIGQYNLFGGENDHNGFRLVSAVPEPSSLLLFGFGMVTMLGLRRRVR